MFLFYGYNSFEFAKYMIHTAVLISKIRYFLFFYVGGPLLYTVIFTNFFRIDMYKPMDLFK